MSKNLEELKWFDIENPNHEAIELIVEVLEDFEKRLKKVEAELGIYTEEEIKKIKVGGTDSD